MARAYSLDLRKRVVAAVAGGQTCRTVAERFGVSVARVVKWSQRFRATGSAAAKPMGGWRPYVLEGERHWLLTRVSEAPDLTLRALAAELAQRGSRSATMRSGTSCCGRALRSKSRPCGRRNVGALSCTWKGAAECFLVASDPVKKHGPWAVAGLKVATPSGDPVLGN